MNRLRSRLVQMSPKSKQICVVVKKQTQSMFPAKSYGNEITLNSFNPSNVESRPELFLFRIGRKRRPQGPVAFNSLGKRLLNRMETRKKLDDAFSFWSIGQYETDTLLRVSVPSRLGNVSPEVSQRYIAHAPCSNVRTLMAYLLRDVVTEKCPQVEIFDCAPCTETVFSLECQFKTEHRP